jgi:hypothetical protein
MKLLTGYLSISRKPFLVLHHDRHPQFYVKLPKTKFLIFFFIKKQNFINKIIKNNTSFTNIIPVQIHAIE